MEIEVCVDRIHLDHASEFKYLGCVLAESSTDGTECSRKLASGKRVAGAIMSLVNATSLQLGCGMVLHESLLVPLMTYGSEPKIWREKENSRIRAVQMETSEVCWESGEWIKSRMHGFVSFAERRRLGTKGLMKVFSDGSA